MQRKKLSLRAIVEINNGMLFANVGDVAETFITAFYVPYLIAYHVITDLLPGLASLRGGLMSSMAARISTSIYLGSLEAKVKEIASRELPRVLPLSLLMSIYILLLVYPGASFEFWKGLAISLLASIIAFSVLFSFTISFSIFGFKKGINLDNVMAPVITVAGDIITIPSLVYSTLLIYRLRHGVEGITSLALLWVSLTVLLYAVRIKENSRTIFESIPALILLGILEAGAGKVLTFSAKMLKVAGVLQGLPSFLEDTGAIASVTASRMSTDIHLYGRKYVRASLPIYLIEALLGSFLGYTMLSLIVVFAGRTTGLSENVLLVTSIILIGGIIETVIGSLLAYLVTIGSHRFGFDPDNVSIPILTSAMDFLGTLILAYLSALLYRLIL